MKKMTTLLLVLASLFSSAQNVLLHECGFGTNNDFVFWGGGYFFSSFVATTSTSYNTDNTLDMAISLNTVYHGKAYINEEFPQMANYENILISYHVIPNDSIEDEFSIWLGDSTASAIPFIDVTGWELVNEDFQSSGFLFNNENRYTQVFMGFRYPPANYTRLNFRYFKIEADTSSVGVEETWKDEVDVYHYNGDLVINNAPGNYELEILDLSGKQMIRRECEGDIRFNTMLNDGIYIVSLVSKSARISKQVFIRQQ